MDFGFKEILVLINLNYLNVIYLLNVLITESQFLNTNIFGSPLLALLTHEQRQQKLILILTQSIIRKFNLLW